MELLIDDMESAALFHVIDAKTSYNLLLGRPWLHENGVVPSTWHQCFKYCHNGVVKKVCGDSKPFTEAESHFADAKYYLNKVKTPEAGTSEKKEKQEDRLTKEDETNKMRLRSCPAKEPAIDNALKSLTLPLTQIDGKTTPQSLSKTMKEHQEAQKLRTEKCFNPKAYKLLIKAGYNPQEQSPLGKLPQNSSSQNPRAGLGYEQPRGPVRIAIRRASSSNVTTEDCSSKIEQEPTRVSVFKRLGPLMAKKC
jgi:hypothetical protein